MRRSVVPYETYRASAMLALIVAAATALPLLAPRAPDGIPVFWLANAVLLVAVLRARPESLNRFLLVGFLVDVAVRLALGRSASRRCGACGVQHSRSRGCRRPRAQATGS